MSSQADVPHLCFNMSTYAVVTPRIVGLISAVSSSLIIHVILKSKSKLDVIYHRILFGMSCYDILGSVAVAFSTLPMPKGFPDDVVVDCYDEWNVTRLGNTQTCEAQGFCWIFGFVSMMAYNGSLCVYYASAIAFRIPEKKIQKYIEPGLHLMPLVLGLLGSVPPLFLGRYNPSGWEPHCTVISIGCDNGDCFRGYSNHHNSHIQIFLIAALSCLFVTVIMPLLLVICRVLMLDRRLGAFISQDSQVSIVEGKNSNAKAVTKQALSYIFAMFIATIFGLLDSVARHSDYYPMTLFVNLKIFFMPLVGFFNFIIFIYHKAHAIQKTNDDKSFWQIFWDLFSGEAEEPVFLSRISILEVDEHRKRIDMILQNECGEERVSYSIGSPWDDLEQPSPENVERRSIVTGGQESSTSDSSDDKYIGNPSVADTHGKSMTSSQVLSFGSRSDVHWDDNSDLSPNGMSQSRATGSFGGGISMNQDMSKFGLSSFDSNESLSDCGNNSSGKSSSRIPKSEAAGFAGGGVSKDEDMSKFGLSNCNSNESQSDVRWNNNSAKSSSGASKSQATGSYGGVVSMDEDMSKFGLSSFNSDSTRS